MKRLLEIIGLGILLSYFYGFLIWNIFLGRFGFFEYNLLQTRFISAGLFYFLFIYTAFLISFFFFILFISKITKQKIESFTALIKDRNIQIIFFIFSILYTSIYTFFPFPMISQSIGGGKPFYISIIADPTTIDYLNDFGLSFAENAEGKDSIQTEIACSIYQNNDFVVLGITDPQETENGVIYNNNRVLILRKELINGFNIISQKTISPYLKIDCQVLMNQIY